MTPAQWAILHTDAQIIYSSEFFPKGHYPMTAHLPPAKAAELERSEKP